ncbi:MAG TPA: glycosyl transferase [Coriobacteriia bacterium]|nr:glycosyl transferase [Coriobacteriia bacterium]
MNSSENNSLDGQDSKSVTEDGATVDIADKQKLISFSLPCYNASEYMDHCIESILVGAKNFLDVIEIIVVNDGSNADDTGEKADEWQRRYPDIIKAVHQENGGHGQAVNAGLANATGLYFKVVDSDDWLDADALNLVLVRLKWLVASDLDMMVTNYVYEKVGAKKPQPIKYKSVMPTNRIFGWDEVGTFKPQQNLLMHAVIYRTQLLRDIGLELPRHTFYVDNIFVYVPLPSVTRIYYLDVDLYRYYIGREGQSVNEGTMIKRIDQQLKVTRIMIDSFHLREDVTNPCLQKYMIHYLSMMMAICSIFLRLSDREDAEEQRKAIWTYLKEHDPKLYPKLRGSAVGIAANLPGSGGRAVSKGGYKVVRRLFNFN